MPQVLDDVTTRVRRRPRSCAATSVRGKAGSKPTTGAVVIHDVFGPDEFAELRRLVTDHRDLFVRQDSSVRNGAAVGPGS